MRYSRLAVGIIVVSLLAVAVASGPATAQIEGTDQEEAEICGGAPSGNSLVLVLPGDTYVHADDEATLLPGTTGELALCSDGELQIVPSAWELDEGSVTGLNVTAEHEYSYAVTVENVEESTSVEFSLTTSPGSVESPSVRATPGQVTTARIDGSTYRIAVDNTRKEAFAQANESYVDTLTEIRTTAATLAETTETGQISATSNTTDRWIATLNQTRAVTTNYTTIQSTLFDSARNGNADAVGALNAYEQYHNRTLNQTSADLERANQAIARQAGATALGVLANLLGLFLVGSVIGGLGGRYLTNRILSDVEVDRRRSSAVDFRPKHLTAQFVIAVVLVGAAVALVVLQGLLDPLVAVVSAAVQAVIGL